MTRLSIKALRLYDGLGILQPLHIDPQIGYRYHGIDQLPSAREIWYTGPGPYAKREIVWLFK